MRKGVRAIARGGIDFALQTRNNNEIQLEHCGGAPQSSFDVNAIPNRTQNFRLFGLGNRPGAFFVSYDQISRILRFGSRTVLKKRIASRKPKKLI